MLLFISFLFLILAIIGFAKDNGIISPLFITPFIWSALLSLYAFVPHSMYPLKEQFLISLSIWVFFFYVFCFFTAISELKIANHTLYNKNVFTVYYYILIIAAPLALTLLVLEALKVGPEMFFLKLRMINTGQDEDETFSLGPLGLVYNFSSVIALLFTFYKDRISKSQYYTVILLAFFLGLITLARTSLVSLTIGIFVVQYFAGRIKLKHYTYFGLVFFAFIVLLTNLRNQADSGGSTFYLYIFGAMPAFDTIQFQPQEQFGAQTLRFFYAIANAAGGSFEVKETILPFTNVPQEINVYTVLQPFYKDFGFYGIAIFAAIYGLLFGVTYKLAKQNNPFMILMYAFSFSCLLLQFFGEYIFSNLSTFLQYAIVLMISKRLKF